MKKLTLVFFAISLIVLSCSKKKNDIYSAKTKQDKDLSSVLLEQIDYEINQINLLNTKIDNNPANNNNPFDYAGIYMRESYDSIIAKWSYITDTSKYCNSRLEREGILCFNDSSKYFGTIIQVYHSKGYSYQKILDTISTVQNLIITDIEAYSTVQNLLNDYVQRNYITSYEKNVLISYFSHFYSQNNPNIIHI